MNADESARQGRVSDAEPLSHRHANASDTQLGRRIRALAADLMRDVLSALATASATEIGQLLAQAGDVSLARATRVRASTRNALSRPVPLISDSERDAASKPPIVPNSPFDITSPGELLASPDEVLPRTPDVRRKEVADRAPAEPTEAQPVTETHVAAPLGNTADRRATAAPAERAAESSTALRDVDADAASERRPKVVLRAGERLLSATGSGVVIRRERRVAPTAPKE